MHYWKVVPLCEEQLLDIKPEDILPGKVFRVCDVYKSGGGYDKFPQICKKRLGIKTNPKQFIVQLYGCHLRCPYCYVTPNGVWGSYTNYTTDLLIKAFRSAERYLDTKLDVFHLMGGSPALYIEKWPELIDALSSDKIFHSDLLLTEKEYSFNTIMDISRPNCLYAVNIKGVTAEDYFNNTGGYEFPLDLFEYNLDLLIKCEVNFYITFTAPDMKNYYKYCQYLKQRFGKNILNDSFIIDVIGYDAVKFYNNKSIKNSLSIT
jgi:uncharacterized Fe-S cluster-containing radical SAM superfamily protein